MLSLILAAAMASAPLETPAWHDGLDWHGVHVGIQHDAQGAYTLAWPFGQRVIAPQAFKADTASALFDGLYAMAQDDLRQDSVSAIRDGAFDHGAPIPCHCFETGLKWPYVWTRDLSYAIDLGLWRFDSARARNGLEFKLSGVREASALQGLYVMQDTGSGGSWPISTDRVVWFLAARHLQDDGAFADKLRTALDDTLAQDRQYAFDADSGLYRGETSFLDWREQTYPAWTANEVTFIGQSFALSTNVLHYEALQLAAELAGERHEATARNTYRTQAAALKQAINLHFWRADRGMYMSYIGGDDTPVDSYDLLGISLAITSGVADGERARQTLENYPSWPAGSPVIWPERSDQPIYHNRAIWPFVSAYALRAARTINDPVRIAHEIESVMRGAALYGSNMENYELLTQGQHVDEGTLSGPVVNSPRQLWSVAAYLDVVAEGVFGLRNDGQVQPKLPVSLVPMLFGKRNAISLDLPDRQITLQLPAKRDGNLLVADRIRTQGTHTTVTLKAIRVDAPPLRMDAPLYAPIAPAAPTLTADGDHWTVKGDGKLQLYVNGQRAGVVDGSGNLARTAGLACVRATRVDAHGLESLPSPATCVGPVDQAGGDWPRHWTAPATGNYRVWADYRNANGPINTGVTAAVKWLLITCDGSDAQRVPLVMPHSVATQPSTHARFSATTKARCTFALEDGFNMSYLQHFAHYTGGTGGIDGPLNQAEVDNLHIAPLASGTGTP
ncbi:Six-hairpin glycosidase-like protein [Rhodanobacter lindaniclasticus]|uniref:Six-hairpin glycosidase-like protein n=1 Tax=Rhodanobacter lindaniclasticus TaxID=75310 RepID=A0A4S3KIA5_9GAMM|nr:Six-hairpin glycosidase-like protein [Rhodanobacter lindaniclasticus]THD08290.1 Six-hairpin glycosidase-like protein [Rhodanobacter lindaniclasticus]